MRSDLRWQLLVAILAAVVLLAGIFTPAPGVHPSGFLFYLPIVLLFAATFTLVTLLACWAMFSHGRPRRRVFGVALGLGYLEAMFDVSLRGNFLGMPAGSLLAGASGLFVAHRLGVRLGVPDELESAAGPASRWPQFTIRSLMVLTAIVALLVAGFRALKLPPYDTAAVVWGLGFAVVGLLGVWAIMGRSHLAGRCGVLFLTSPLAGVAVAQIIGADREGRVYIVAIMVLHSALLLGSLALVRSRGIRLIRATIDARPAGVAVAT